MTTTATPIRPGDWAADPAACTLTFAVRNFVLRTVTGQIPLTSAVIHVDPGGHPASIRAELDAQGIDTGNRRRDKDLRGLAKAHSMQSQRAARAIPSLPRWPRIRDRCSTAPAPKIPARATGRSWLGAARQ